MGIETLVPEGKVNVPKSRFGRYTIITSIITATIVAIMALSGCGYANNSIDINKAVNNNKIDYSKFEKDRIDVGASNLKNLYEAWEGEGKPGDFNDYVNQVISDNRFNNTSALINNTGQITNKGTLIMRNYDREVEKDLVYIKK